MQEAVPLGWELLPQVKQAQRRRRPILIEVRPEMRHCAVLERPGVFPRRVFHVQNGVRNSAIIELAQRLAEVSLNIVKQFERPFADSTSSLERQVALIAEAQFE